MKAAPKIDIPSKDYDNQLKSITITYNCSDINIL